MSLPEEPYQYQPLQHPDSIRLLKLWPQAHEDDQRLACELVEAQLSDNPFFEAISYVWGEPVLSQTIYLPQGFLKATENLAAALTHFRDPVQPRYLWADAICINQRDVEEKNTQVAFMGSIYEAAACVLIWLGDSDEYTSGAIASFKNIAASAASCGITEVYHQVKRNIKHTPPTPAEEEALARLESETDFHQLSTIYQRPWFSRLWIIQEVSLSRKSLLYCGHYEIDFAQLVIATALITVLFRLRSLAIRGLKFASIKFASLVVDSWEATRHQKNYQPDPDRSHTEYYTGENPIWLPQWMNLKLLDYVSTIKNRCYDDRDRIYALQSLGPEKDIRMVPDYKKPVAEVYTEFARLNLEAGNIQILSYASLAQNSGIERPGDTSEQLPSWVPDWRKETNLRFGGSEGVAYNAGTAFSIDAKITKEGAGVEFSGILLDIVKVAQGGAEPPDRSLKLGFANEPLRVSLRALKQFYSDNKRPGQYITGEDHETIFARSVMADGMPASFREMHPGFADPKGLVEFWKLFEQAGIREDGGLDLDPAVRLLHPESGAPLSRRDTVLKAWTYMVQLFTILADRQMFVSSQGFLGLAPSMAAPGDLLVIVGGCKAPLILRPSEDGDTFRLIGEAYVHGFMYGEMTNPGYLEKLRTGFVPSLSFNSVSQHERDEMAGFLYFTLYLFSVSMCFRLCIGLHLLASLLWSVSFLD